MAALSQGKVITCVAKEKVELLPLEPDALPLKTGEIRARTLVSLVSSGTEVVGCYSATHYQLSYPARLGYASVSRVEEMGAEVGGLAVGDLVLGGGHRSLQRGQASSFVKVPAGLAPEKAVFARMAKISMPAFVRAGVRPPELLVITGLGLVGMMAAQLGQIYGYRTLACDPSAKRREIARRHGIADVAEAIPLRDPLYAKRVGFGLDCSGHEQAVLDLCDVVRPWGEVAMVGVPWVPRTSMLAQKLLQSVFYNFVDLKSGWECRPPEGHGEVFEHEMALRWVAEGRLKVDPCAYRVASPADAQRQYQDLLHGKVEELTVMFDWRQL
jgi:threonine dehydrogenase-like Zn-dependent dehydrogenase